MFPTFLVFFFPDPLFLILSGNRKCIKACFLVAIHLILFELACNEDIHNILDEVIFNFSQIGSRLF